MLRFAVRSLRHRTGAFVASFVALLMGAAIVMAFGAGLDTGLADGVPKDDRKLLVITAAVVGGWAVVLAAFAVTSTLTLAVRQRAAEMALLKSIGATPRQIRRLVVGEVSVVAVLAGLLATAPGYGIGRLVHHLLQRSDQLDATTGFRFGPVAWVAGLLSTIVAASIAARVTARRTADLGAHDTLVDAALEAPGLGRRRRIAALVFLGLAIQAGVLTAFMFDGNGPEAQQTGGQACIAAAIGLALLAPVLVRRATDALGGIVERVGGASGWLAVQNLRQRSRQMATALMPIIVFTTIATGTLYMQSIENGASAASGPRTADDKNLATLNYVVVGIIGAFAAVILVNTVVAATRARSHEFAELRLVGSTRRQVLTTVLLESLVLLITGIVFGTIASLVTIVPYSITRTDSVWPSAGPGIWLGVAATAVIVTLEASLGTARRLLRVPAAEAATP